MFQNNSVVHFICAIPALRKQMTSEHVYCIKYGGGAGNSDLFILCTMTWFTISGLLQN